MLNRITVAETLSGFLVYDEITQTYEIENRTNGKRFFAELEDFKNSLWYSQDAKLAAMPYIANLQQFAEFLKEAIEIEWESEND